MVWVVLSAFVVLYPIIFISYLAAAHEPELDTPGATVQRRRQSEAKKIFSLGAKDPSKPFNLNRERDFARSTIVAGQSRE
jgi:hypothetical protein